MEIVQQGLAAIAVLGLLAVLLWSLQKRGLARFAAPAGTSRRMQVVERMPLTAQHALHLVRIEGRLVVVASAPGGCSVLSPIATKEDQTA